MNAGKARHRTAYVLATAVAAVGALVAPATGQAKTPDLIAHYNWLSTTCVPAAQGTVRAKVVVRMIVVNHEGLGGDWAQRMRAEARLITTTPGLQYSRAWKKVKTPILTINRRHSYTMTVITDNVSPNAEWKVQLKLIWDRPTQRDVVKEKTGKFVASCGGVDLGS